MQQLKTIKLYMQIFPEGIVGVVLVLCLLSTSVSAATGSHDSRHKAFLSEVKTVALLPLAGPRFKSRDDVPELVEEIIREKLSNHDIATVPGELYLTLRNEKLHELGGIYDPITGKKLDDNVSQIREYTRQDIESQYQVDAYLIPTLVIKDVPYRESTAKWDGVRENIWQSFQLWRSAQGGGVDSGNIRGLSLSIRLEKPDGTEIYTGEGAWQLIDKFGREGRQPILPADLFDNEEYNRLAVHFALRRLLLDFKDVQRDEERTNRAHNFRK